MKDRTAIRCRKCDEEIPVEERDVPCPNCGDLRRKYVATLSAKLGFTVELSDKVQKNTFRISYLLIILSALTYYVIATFNILPDQKNLVFWLFVGFGILILIVAFILASIRITVIEKLKNEKTKFDWKSADGWISRLKLGAVLFLFSFISMYLLISIAAPKNSLHLDFVIISATFGGLVLAAASFQQKGDFQSQLFQVAKKFILATVLLIMFLATYKVLDSIEFDPSTFELSLDWLTKELVFLAFVVCTMFGGVYSFSKAVIDLLDLLRTNQQDQKQK